jgi:RNA polymerase sigma factor (sigma-70 family)
MLLHTPTAPVASNFDIEEAYTCFSQALLQKAQFYLNDQQKAEDAVSTTWELVVRYKHTFDGKQLRSWLFKILTNVIRNEYGTQGTLSLDTLMNPEDSPFLPKALWTEDPTNDQVESIALAERLEAAYQTLPKAYREALILHLRGEDARAAANSLGITYLAYRIRVSRARQRMRLLLKDERR